MDTGLSVGNVLRLRNFRTYSADGMSSLDFTAEKGKVFVVCLLGFEPKTIQSPEDSLDLTKVLREMGWVRPEEVVKPDPPKKRNKTPR